MKELAIHVSQISCYKINKLQKPDGENSAK